MNGRQQLIVNIIAITLVSAVLIGFIVWILGGISFGYVQDSINLRREQRQKLFDLQGPQEAYKKTLEGDAEVIAMLNSSGFLDLFLDNNDVLSFILDIEGLADKAGVNHELSDRGLIDVPRRQSRIASDELQGLSEEERAAVNDLLAKRDQRGPEIDSILARQFTIEITGSFDAAARFIGMLEELLPLVMIESATVRSRTISELTLRDSATLPSSLRGGFSDAISAAMEIRVFLDE